MWHRADWQKVKEKPESIQLPREDWIFKHDAEKHAEEVFGDVRKAIQEDAAAKADINGVSAEEIKGSW